MWIFYVLLVVSVFTLGYTLGNLRAAQRALRAEEKRRAELARLADFVNSLN